ncbi:MAG: polyprenyl synthetase family protein [Pyrinomonadaceae bacterium]
MPQLDDFFAEVTSLLDAEMEWLVPVEGGKPHSLRDAIRWSLFAGGKHFRPALVFAVGRAFNATNEKLIRTASAIEMLHTYSLIHDDLPSMDDDDLRRGRETCHRKFGEATAILAGDALQALAFQVISEDGRLSVETRVDLVSKLAQAAAKMVVGQQLDLEAEGTIRSLEEIENIHRNKTGALIRFSAQAGAIIGAADLASRETVSSFGEKIGLLFQMKDDLLDVTKTTEELGKTAGKDTAAAKATYPAISGIERTEILAKQLHAEAKFAISNLGERGALLNQIADFILTRNS